MRVFFGEPCHRCLQPITKKHDPQNCKHKASTCYSCQKVGHIKPACPGGRANRAQSAYDDEDDDSEGSEDSEEDTAVTKAVFARARAVTAVPPQCEEKQGGDGKCVESVNDTLHFRNLCSQSLVRRPSVLQLPDDIAVGGSYRQLLDNYQWKEAHAKALHDQNHQGLPTKAPAQSSAPT